MSVKRRTPVAVHLLFGLLLLLIALPGGREDASPVCFVIAACLVEAACLWGVLRGRGRRAGDVGALIFVLFLLWEGGATVLNLAHPILIPTPEAVFQVFARQYRLMLRGIGSSLSLLGLGFAAALPLGVVLGALAGWCPRLREAALPIARTMAPIPAIIYAPYLIALMPTFRAASAAVIVLGVFWPTFLQTADRVKGMDRALLDSARVMVLTDREMVFEVFLPWLLPGVFSGLRVSLSTSFMLLMLAEMMGASSGLGYFIKNYADYANYTNVLAGIILVALVVTGLNGLLSAAEQKWVPWK